jgi:hypothetical protein
MANGLRALADAVETYGGENWPLPYGIEVRVDVAEGEYKTVDGVYQMVYDTEATKKSLRKALRGLKGKKEKLFNDWLFAIRKDFGGGVRFTVEASRAAVCRKVPTGNIIKHAAHTEYIPERTEEEYEWVCEDGTLLKGVQETFSSGS